MRTLALALCLAACAREYEPWYPNPTPQTAILYVYRNPSLYGSAVAVPILDGEDLIGYAHNRAYFVVEIPPGEHSITARGETSSGREFLAVAGRAYYLSVTVRTGFLSARSTLRMESEQEGLGAVHELRFIPLVKGR